MSIKRFVTKGSSSLEVLWRMQNVMQIIHDKPNMGGGTSMENVAARHQPR
jgi:hypothetical protein